jgi:hypothetical protein
MPWFFVRSPFRFSGTSEAPEKVSTRIHQQAELLKGLREHVICQRVEQTERRETRENYGWMLNLPSIQL